MRMYFAVSAVLLSVLLLSNCTKESDERMDIRSYYFPIDDLTIPMVYEYRPVNDTLQGPTYWYFRTVETDTATYFTTNIYNQFFEVEQFSTEEVVSNGTMVKDYFLFAFDSTGIQKQLPAEIEFNSAFPFLVKDSSGVFLQKLKWTFSESPIHTTTVIKNRRYIGAVQHNYQGKLVDAIKFQIREIIDDFTSGHLETETIGEEIYAKNIGLIYYKKTVGNNITLEYELADRYTMEALEQKFAEASEEK